ncbi:MAG: Spy/CpxP family protein refolding chaperone [Sulfurovum sp.]|nr:Spy/CpxP family protein refolding chaperone [Sulfurovum sp.]
MKTLKVLTIVAITGLAGTVTANACPAGVKKTICEKQEMCTHKNGKRGEMKEIFQKLDLTAEQKSAMKESRKEMRAEIKEKRSQRHTKRGMENMSGFVSAEGFDKDAFIAKATEKSQTMIEMRADRFEKRMNILTPEQRVKFVTLLQEKQK